MKKSTVLYLVCTLLFLTSACDPHGWQDDPALATKLQAQIEQRLSKNLQFEGDSVATFTLEERMAHYNVPGLSIAVVKNGAILWAKGYGIADTKTNSEVDEQTLFQAGSISKPIAALAALKLVQEGKLDLDVDINEYLSSWKIPDTKFTEQEKVTLRRLLTHNAGVTVHGFPGYAQTDTFPSDIEVLNGQGNTGAIFVDTFPGAITRYSGGGYTIMERAVEDISGQSFTSYLSEQVLSPLKMERSTYEQPIGESWTNLSAAYDGSGKRYSGAWHNYPEQAAAGLWTTPSDLAKYIIEIQEVAQGKTGQVLQTEMVQQMLTQDGGLGPMTRYEGDSLMFGHGGKNAGFTNDLRAWVYRGEGIVVMTSADRGGALIREIERAASEIMDWDLSPARVETAIELTPQQMAKRVGKYEWKAQNYEIEVRIQAGQLEIFDPSNGRIYPLRALDALNMIDTEDLDKMTFEQDADGQVTAVMQNGRYRFEKID